MEILSGMIEYAMFYENSEHNGSSTGRSGTTKNIVKSALNDAKYFLLVPDLVPIKTRRLQKKEM